MPSCDVTLLNFYQIRLRYLNERYDEIRNFVFIWEVYETLHNVCCDGDIGVDYLRPSIPGLKCVSQNVISFKEMFFDDIF